MKEKLSRLFSSKTFLLVQALVVVPLLSFMLITVSEESPLYTSISRIAWVHGYWFATFLWALVVMGTIVWLTWRMVSISPLSQRTRIHFFLIQFIHIALVFTGCLLFPAKPGPDAVRFVHLVHDYLTAAAWLLYVIGLIAYSLLIRKKDRFLGFLGLCLMGFVVLSSVFYLLRVIDPSSYVGASALSEVYIINGLLIYLAVMYVAQDYTNRLQESQPVAHPQ